MYFPANSASFSNSGYSKKKPENPVSFIEKCNEIVEKEFETSMYADFLKTKRVLSPTTTDWNW